MSRRVEANVRGLFVRDTDADDIESLEQAEARGVRAPTGEPLKAWLRSLLGRPAGMSLGDVVEMLGLGCLVAAGYLAWGLAPGVALLGSVLLYEGQCYASHPVPKLHRPRLRRARSGEETATRAERGRFALRAIRRLQKVESGQ